MIKMRSEVGANVLMIIDKSPRAKKELARPHGTIEKIGKGLPSRTIGTIGTIGTRIAAPKQNFDRRKAISHREERMCVPHNK